MIDASKYNITVRKGEFEGEVCFEARVSELPDVAEYGDSFEEAYALAIDTVEISAEELESQSKAMPVPLEPSDDFSGRVTLRLPKSLHRALAGVADGEGVSLNQHLVNVLSYYSGFAQGKALSHKDKGLWDAGSMKSSSSKANYSTLTVVSNSPINKCA